MKAAWIDNYGGIDVIQTSSIPIPKRKTGEILIKIVSSTLNHHDVYVRRGEAGHTKLPVVLGSDGAGYVIDCDSASKFSKGDKVVIYPVISCGKCISCCEGLPHKCQSFGMLGGEEDGIQAEYASVPEACVVPMPDGLEFERAAAISLAGLTAWNMVIDEGRAVQGEHALVLGASGGVGIFTVALLKRLGVHVHAVTSSPEKKEFLLELGVETVLDDSPVSVLRHTRALNNGGVDMAFNWVGGDSWRYVAPAVRSGGRILVCGAVRSPVAEIDMRQIFYRNISLLGCSMGTPGALEEMLKVAEKDNDLSVKIDQVITIDEIPEAQKRMEAGNITGKIVVRNTID